MPAIIAQPMAAPPWSSSSFHPCFQCSHACTAMHTAIAWLLCDGADTAAHTLQLPSWAPRPIWLQRPGSGPCCPPSTELPVPSSARPAPPAFTAAAAARLRLWCSLCPLVFAFQGKPVPLQCPWKSELKRLPRPRETCTHARTHARTYAQARAHPLRYCAMY